MWDVISGDKPPNVNSKIMLDLYALHWGAQDHTMFHHWCDIAERFALDLDARFYDLGKRAHLINTMNITSTPTTIITIPGEKPFRCFGYDGKIEDLLVSYALRLRAKRSVIDAKSMHNQAQLMGIEAARMSSEGMEMVETSKQLLEKSKQILKQTQSAQNLIPVY